MITYEAAIDEIYGIVNAALPDAAAILSYIPEVRWQGSPKPGKPPVDKLWMRVSNQIVKDSQSSLANVNGVRRYHAIGLLYVQIFASRIEAGSVDHARLWAVKLRGYFRGGSPSGSITFRDQKIVELPASDDNYPFNVIVTFEYDDVEGAQVFSIPLSGNSSWHLPVEALDGIRTVFSFVGLPVDQNQYLLVWNGIIQQPPIVQNANQITLDVAPKLGDPFAAYY